MADVVYINQTDFRDQLQALRRKGGAYEKAHKNACQIIESLRHGDMVDNRITNNGESRIDHAVKYDLGHACRLVTVQTDNFIYLLYVGTHDDAERWIERNRGLTIMADLDTREFNVIHIRRPEHYGSHKLPQYPESAYTEENIPFFKRIPDFDVAEYVPQPFIVKQLLKISELTSDNEIQDIIDHINEGDPELACFLLDLIGEIRSENIDGARLRVRKEQGKAAALIDNPSLEKDAVGDLSNAQRIANLSGMSKEDVERLFSADGFRDWMLFLHPEQKKIAEADYDKPTILTGVSGSGKTVVLVHRARFLARKYPEERIGVITLSRSLAKLISSQLDQLCTGEVRSRIHVYAFYDYFKEMLDLFGPGPYLEQLKIAIKGHDYESEILNVIERVEANVFAREYDPLSGESLDDTWDIFIDQPGAQNYYSYFREHVEKYQANINAEEYLKEEFSLVRSAFSTTMRKNDYPNLERNGRAIPLPQDIRKRVLDLLNLYEETMLSGGMLDVLSLTAALLPNRTKIAELPPEKRFRALLVDEFQDFSTLDLSLLRTIPTNRNENGLFLTGDPVQRVLVKDLRLGAIGLDILSATREKIQRNYRNSRQILDAAFLLANQYGEVAKKQGEDIEVLDPELAIRETAPPIILKSETPEDELILAWQKIEECLEAGGALPWSVTICTACPTKISTQQIIDSRPAHLNVDAKPLTGDYTEDKNTVTVGTMSELKGFEFSLVVVVGCGDGFLPLKERCREEIWRDALRLYVAMTRARDSVFLSFSGKPSPFLEAMREKLSWPEEVTAP